MLNKSNIKSRILLVIYSLLVVAGCYIFYNQTKETREETEKVRDKISDAGTAPVPHPLLISNYHRNRDYVQAIDLIRKSEYKRIWAVSDFLDPTFVLNYYIYPKQLVMNTEMQDIVNYGRKIMQDEVPNFKPSQYEAILFVKPGSVHLSESWDSYQ